MMPQPQQLQQLQQLQEQQQQQQQQQPWKGHELDSSSTKIKTEKKMLLLQKHAAVDVFRLMRRRDRFGLGFRA